LRGEESQLTYGSGARNIDQSCQATAFVFNSSSIPLVSSFLSDTFCYPGQDYGRACFSEHEWHKNWINCTDSKSSKNSRLSYYSYKKRKWGTYIISIHSIHFQPSLGFISIHPPISGPKPVPPSAAKAKMDIGKPRLRMHVNHPSKLRND